MIFGCGGFTDAKGCFTCSLLGNCTAYRFRYILAQLGDINLSVLMHPTTLVKGVIRFHSIRVKGVNNLTVKGVNKLTVNGVNNLTVKGVRNITSIFDYFESHPLITKKSKCYMF